MTRSSVLQLSLANQNNLPLTLDLIPCKVDFTTCTDNHRSKHCEKVDSEIKDLLVKQTMNCQLWQTTGNNVYMLSQCIFVILQYFSMFSIYSPKILAQLLS